MLLCQLIINARLSGNPYSQPDRKIYNMHLLGTFPSSIYIYYWVFLNTAIYGSDVNKDIYRTLLFASEHYASFVIALLCHQACDNVKAEIEREILGAGRRLATKYVAKEPSRKVSLA